MIDTMWDTRPAELITEPLHAIPQGITSVCMIELVMDGLISHYVFGNLKDGSDAHR